METERTKPNKLLKGKENYLPWLNYLEGIADVDDLFELKEPTEELTVAANSTSIFQGKIFVLNGANSAAKRASDKKVKKWILDHITETVLSLINVKDSSLEIMLCLNRIYGFANIDPISIKNEIKEIKFTPGKDPQMVFNHVTIKVNELSSAGGEISDSELCEIYFSALKGDPVRNSFWFNCIGQINMAGLSTYSSSNLEIYIQKFHQAHYVVPIRRNYEAANYTYPRATNSRNEGRPKRFCAKCARERPKKPNLATSHDEEYCKFDVDGVYQKDAPVNKPTEQCLLSIDTQPEIIYDTGSTKTMINFQPKVDVKETRTKVYTAGTYQPPQLAECTGKIKLGQLYVDALHVPFQGIMA